MVYYCEIINTKKIAIPHKCIVYFYLFLGEKINLVLVFHLFVHYLLP